MPHQAVERRHYLILLTSVVKKVGFTFHTLSLRDHHHVAHCEIGPLYFDSKMCTHSTLFCCGINFTLHKCKCKISSRVRHLARTAQTEVNAEHGGCVHPQIGFLCYGQWIVPTGSYSIAGTSSQHCGVWSCCRASNWPQKPGGQLCNTQILCAWWMFPNSAMPAITLQ